MLLVSVVVPTHKRAHILGKVLAAFSTQSCDADQFEVVVVVDGHDPDAAGLLAGFDAPFALRWLEQPHRGAPAARNLGVREARAPLIIFVDDDVIPTAGFIAAHLARHQDRDAIVQGAVRLHPQSPELLIGEAIDWTVSHYARCSAPGYTLSNIDLSNANWSVRKQHLIDCGGWDENFTGFGGPDDRELALRLLRRGRQIEFAPEALSHHYFCKSWEHVLSDYRHMGRADGYFLRKHAGSVHHVGISSWTHAGVWRRMLFRLVGLCPEFAFRATHRAARRFSPLKPVYGGAMLKWIVRCTRAAFHCRGYCDQARRAIVSRVPGAANDPLANLRHL